MNQHKLLLLALLSTFIVPLARAKSCSSPVTVVCPAIDCGVNVVHISQADLPVVIDAPGVYCVTEDLTWAPPQPPHFHAVAAQLTPSLQSPLQAAMWCLI